MNSSTQNVKRLLQNYVVGTLKLPAPEYTRLEPLHSTTQYFVQVRVGTLGVYHGLGHSFFELCSCCAVCVTF